jgi:hypothetical protein
MKKYLIKREVPKIGTLDGEQFCEIAATSNNALSQLSPHVQWVESFVTDDNTFCIYLAEDESFIHRHAELSGFPANEIIEIRRTIDPTTASSR